MIISFKITSCYYLVYNVSDSGIDLLKKIIEINPKTRIHLKEISVH